MMKLESKAKVGLFW